MRHRHNSLDRVGHGMNPRTLHIRLVNLRLPQDAKPRMDAAPGLELDGNLLGANRLDTIGGLLA